MNTDIGKKFVTKYLNMVSRRTQNKVDYFLKYTPDMILPDSEY